MEAARERFSARRIERFKFTTGRGEHAESKPARGKARGSSDNLTRLRSGNYSGEVGIFIDRGSRMYPAFGGPFDATLLLMQLLLFTRLFSAAFFPLVILLNLADLAGPAFTARTRWLSPARVGCDACPPAPASFTVKADRAG